MGYSIVNIEHAESESQQEDVNVVVRGGDTWRIGMTFLAVGARRGSYEPRGPL